MNEQIQNLETDTDEDAAPFVWSRPDWCQIRADWDDGPVPRDDTVGIVDSLSQLRSRLRALADVLSSADASNLYDDTAAYIGHIVTDYARQLEDFGELVHARHLERLNAKKETPKPAEPTDPLQSLQAFREHRDAWRQMGEDAFKPKAEEAVRELQSRVEAGERLASEIAGGDA